MAQGVQGRDSGDAVSVSYALGLDLLMEQTGANRFSYHSDGLGSARAITDQSKTVVNRYEYDAFGSQSTADMPGAPSNAFRFAGEQIDTDTGLSYLRARYYDPAIGRFLSRDPWMGEAMIPGTLNRYSYVRGNPVNNVDPLGLGCFGVAGTASVKAGLGPLGGGAGEVGAASVVCWGDRPIHNSAYVEGGGFVGNPLANVGYPAASAGNFAAGISGGLAGSLVLSNAKKGRDLSGHFNTLSIDLGPVPSVQISWSGPNLLNPGTWVLNIAPPQPTSKGVSISGYSTNTRVFNEIPLLTPTGQAAVSASGLPAVTGQSAPKAAKRT